MKKYVVALAVLAMAIVSCTKEKSIDSTDPGSPNPGGGNPGGGTGGGGNSGPILKRTVIQSGLNDSSATLYGYDAGNRLTSQTVVGMGNPFMEEYDMNIRRNSQGMIERVVVKDQLFDDDSSIYKVQYDAGAKRYTYKVGYDADMNEEDSTAFVYDAGGKIIRMDYYLSNGSSWELVEKIENTFDGTGNLTKIVSSEMQGNNARAHSEVRFTYDTKINPLNLGVAEAFILDKFLNTGKNNVTRIEVIDLDDASNNETLEFRFTYDTGNKPTKSEIMLPGFPVGVPMLYRY